MAISRGLIKVVVVGYLFVMVYLRPELLDMFQYFLGYVGLPMVDGIFSAHSAFQSAGSAIAPTYAHMMLEFLQAQGETYKRGYLRKWKGDLDRAESLFQQAAYENPKNGHAWFNIGEIRMLKGDQEAAEWNWKEACDVYARQGVSNAHLVINTRSFGERGYQEILKEEEKDILDCATKIEEERPGRLVKKPLELQNALKAFRATENNATWVLKWARNRYDTALGSAGKTDDNLLYGAVWFAAWRTVCETEPVMAVQKQRPGGLVNVVGSGLGEQCLFALAVGFRKCVGYEIMCKGLVDPGRELLDQQGLNDFIEFKCEDARNVGRLDETSLLFMNDDAFPQELREEIWDKAARQLEPQSVLVTFGTDNKGIPVSEKFGKFAKEHLPMLGRAQVTVSWGQGGTRVVTVAQKVKPKEPKPAPGTALPTYPGAGLPAYPGAPGMGKAPDGISAEF